MPVQAALPDGGASATPLTNVASLFLGYFFGCALDPAGALRCWGASASGTWPEAAIVPTPAPVVSMSSTGTGGFPSALRLLLANGQVVYGGSVRSQVCP